MHHIDPVTELSRDLISIQNPVRYLGGEFGQIIKEGADLTFALSFPDLYEIAMSNLAVKVLYDGLNRLSSVRCERVFAPAPDFEELLKRKKIPLYTLESGIPLNEVDILGVSIGYEPGITGLLAVLDTGCIPIKCKDRGESDPIVLAGGCGITNPAPFSAFIDAFFIGEAEAGLFTLIDEIAQLKKKGAGRSDMLAHLASHPAVWTIEKNQARVLGQVCTRRAVYNEFGSLKDRAVYFPVPSMRVVQDHGVVEIMRGCPNGCRFCHAGMYYRPQRMMSFERILSDVDALVHEGGYREISLMSLSSGDYNGIDRIMTELTNRYSSQNVSFQLPSLKVNSFTLPLLEKMAEVRKSGLTFAVETPVDMWQLAVNKEVYKDKILDILVEARKRGWSTAKFYFMIGLPVEKGGQHEEEEIVKFLLEIQERTRIQCTANIGTFIPKPHTPYQWSHQLTMAEAQTKLDYIYGALPRGRFKISTNRPFNSFVEGMMSRGDERVGDIILKAYQKGCRLDAWDDWAKPDIWRSVIEESSWNVEETTTRERSIDEELPWDGISLGPSKVFLKREKERSENQLLTGKCETLCDEPCGVCGNKTALNLRGTESIDINEPQIEKMIKVVPPEATHRVLVSFTKKKEAAFIAHLSLIEVWHKAFKRSGLPVIFSEGFNPLPRLEIAQSLSLGTSSDDEIASFLLSGDIDEIIIKDTLNRCLPENLKITRAFVFPLTREIRRASLSKYLWGNSYIFTFHDPETRDTTFSNPKMIEWLQQHKELVLDLLDSDSVSVTVPFHLDRPFRDFIAEITGVKIHESMRIHKTASLATGENNLMPSSFFTIFESVAAINLQWLTEKGY